MIILILAIVISVIGKVAVDTILNDYFTYKRLNELTDKLIRGKDMSGEDKIINLCWMSKNCTHFSAKSVFWSRKYDNIVTKIKDYLTESCKESEE